MPLTIHPERGMIVQCLYAPGFKPPEMVKKRAVIVVSPRLRKRDQLCAVVPLSTTNPTPVMPYHHRIKFSPTLPFPYEAEECWVKGDMLNTVGFHRLSPLFLGKDHEGKRRYIFPKLSAEDMAAVETCVLAGLGISLDSDEQ
jgi:uncharacterized protein YifN (PemK superfamily)